MQLNACFFYSISNEPNLLKLKKKYIKFLIYLHYFRILFQSYIQNCWNEHGFDKTLYWFLICKANNVHVQRKKKYASLLLEYKYVKCVITVPAGFNPSAELLQRTQTDLFHH